MLEFALLGPLEVRRDGRPIALGPPKQRAVLAVLLLQNGRVVSTDRIVTDVWGDDVPNSVASSLQAYISNLRRLLRDDERATSPLVRQAPGYRCDIGADQTDLGRFTGLADQAEQAAARQDWASALAASESALALWRGRLVAELADEEWVRVVAAALEERRTACRQIMITSLLGLDRTTTAVAAAADLLNDQPLDERACWLQLVALYRAGRAAEALEAYQAYAGQLDDELGLEPGPALRDLQQGILRQSRDLERWPGSAGATSVPGVVEPMRPMRPATAPAGEPQASSPDVMVGRHRELAAASEVLVPGQTGWVVLQGEAGIGKSRLAQACVQSWTAGGGAVAHAGCPDDDSLPAWWPIRQLLGDLGVPADALLLPGERDIDAARFAVYERVRAALTAAAAERPLLIMIDDVHWSDQTSLGFLTLLAESTPVPGLAVVLTTRPPTTGGGAGVARLLAAVARAPRGRQLDLPPLSLAEVTELAGQISGTELGSRDAATLATRTGGNPFFVTEYARLPEQARRTGGVPAAVRSVLDRRLAGVDPEVLRVLRTAAVIGQILDVDLLEHVTRLDRDDLADVLDDAADEHLIVTGASGAYEFVHALMREQIADGISGLRRQRLHLRIADELAGRGDVDAVLRRATHLVAALPLGDPAAVVEACRAAAESAETRWQSEDAAFWWGCALRAVDLLPLDDQGQRDDLVVAQVQAYARAGRGQTVLDAVDHALESAMRTHRLAACGRIASTLLRSSGAWPWAVYGADPDNPLLRRLQTLAGLVSGDVAAHVQVLAALAVGSCYDPDSRVPDRLSAQALTLAEETGNTNLIADALLARALTFSGIGERAAESVELLDRLALLDHDQARLDRVFCDNLGSMARVVLGRIDEAAERIQSGITGCDLLRLPVSRAQLRWIEAELTLWHGDDLELADERFRRAYEIHRATELYQESVYELSALAVAWERGALVDFELQPGNPALFWLRVVLSALRAEFGADRALAAEVNRDEPVIWTTHGRLTLLGHVVSDLGRADLARSVRARLEPLSGLIGNIGQIANLGPIDLSLARVCLLDGDLGAARRHLAAATDLARRGRARRHLLRCRLLAAELGDLTDPDELERVRTEAARLGVALAQSRPARR